MKFRIAVLSLALASTSCGLYSHEAAGLRRLDLQAGGQTGQYRSLATRNSLRFLVFGDFGSGSEAQVQLGRAMKSQCDADGGCDFALVVGDNIYNSGARSDADFEKKFGVPGPNGAPRAPQTGIQTTSVHKKRFMRPPAPPNRPLKTAIF